MNQITYSFELQKSCSKYLWAWFGFANPLTLITRVSFPQEVGASRKVLKLVQDDPKLLDDGAKIPKSQGRGWRFDSRLCNVLSTWQKTCQVIKCLSCALALACRPYVSKKKEKRKKVMKQHTSILTLTKNVWRQNEWGSSCFKLNDFGTWRGMERPTNSPANPCFTSMLQSQKALCQLSGSQYPSGSRPESSLALNALLAKGGGGQSPMNLKLSYHPLCLWQFSPLSPIYFMRSHLVCGNRLFHRDVQRELFFFRWNLRRVDGCKVEVFITDNWLSFFFNIWVIGWIMSPYKNMFLIHVCEDLKFWIWRYHAYCRSGQSSGTGGWAPPTMSLNVNFETHLVT